MRFFSPCKQSSFRSRLVVGVFAVAAPWGGLLMGLEVVKVQQTWFHVFALACRCSSQLPPLLLQPQLPHTQPEPAPAAAPPQQPRPHHQGGRRRRQFKRQTRHPVYRWTLLALTILVVPALQNTNNQLFCSVKNMERERRGLFGVESNATLPADWKHHEPHKESGPCQVQDLLLYILSVQRRHLCKASEVKWGRLTFKG